MSQARFWAIFGPLAAVAGIVGWIASTPRPAQAVDQHAVASVQSQPPPASSTDPGSATGESSPADSGRDALKARLASSLDRVEASPCDPAARAGLLDAFADRSGAIADAARAGNGDRPPEWNTPADSDADKRIGRLTAAGYFTQDELGLAVVQKRLGQDFVAQQMQQAHGGGPRHSALCDAPAAAHA